MPNLIPYIPDSLTLAVVTGLGALLGKLWANRVSAEEDRKIKSMLARLQSDLERILHVHRVQFEKEFEIYLELSEKMVAVRESLFTINKSLNSSSPQEKNGSTLYRSKVYEMLSLHSVPLFLKTNHFMRRKFLSLLITSWISL